MGTYKKTLDGMTIELGGEGDWVKVTLPITAEMVAKVKKLDISQLMSYINCDKNDIATCIKGFFSDLVKNKQMSAMDATELVLGEAGNALKSSYEALKLFEKAGGNFVMILTKDNPKVSYSGSGNGFTCRSELSFAKEDVNEMIADIRKMVLASTNH